MGKRHIKMDDSTKKLVKGLGVVFLMIIAFISVVFGEQIGYLLIGTLEGNMWTDTAKYTDASCDDDGNTSDCVNTSGWNEAQTRFSVSADRIGTIANVVAIITGLFSIVLLYDLFLNRKDGLLRGGGMGN